MKHVRLSIMALLLSLLHAGAVAKNVTGSWEYHGPAKSGMRLQTEQSDQNVRFQLEVQRGAPSYNSGWIEGEFKLRNNLGVFLKTTEEGLCAISFQFSSGRVELKHLGQEFACQFGHNVFAEGVLRKTQRKPKFSDGDPRTQ
jgi:hypothetical protein